VSGGKLTAKSTAKPTSAARRSVQPLPKVGRWIQAKAGYRKPHTRIYQATLDLTGFKAQDAVFVGDSLRTGAFGPQRVGIRSVLVTRAKEQVHPEQLASLGDTARLILRRRSPL
jgi:HAD superfamily hydrolase (TIGR01509 family)